MKMGFIVECGPEGAEIEVIPYLAKKLKNGIQTDVLPLDRKPNPIARCGEYARGLLANGCACVVIAWDLLPTWNEYERKGCRHNDKAGIWAPLEAAGMKAPDPRIRLVCIEKMLEAWLISDERAIRDFLSTPEHLAEVARQKKTENIRDPKAAMTALFRQSKSRTNRYEDRVHAIKIAARLPDLERLRKCSSFAYFEKQLGHFAT